MTSDLLKQASKQMLAVFNAMPRPRELENIDVWEMIHDDHSGALFMQPEGMLITERNGIIKIGE